MIGDVVGRPGRQILKELLPCVRREYGVDLVIANGENAAGGRGLTLATADELLSWGVDVITSGNHIWDQKGIVPLLDSALPILRPLNYPPGVPGRGYLKKDNILIVNLIGRVFMGNFDCPFRAADQLLNSLTDVAPIVVVDFHAEATSEKAALGWYLDGRASAVLGTHTHVGTVDTRILPKGTAYVTDVGMTAAWDSVIGDAVQNVLTRFMTQMPVHLDVATGRMVFNSVLVEIDESSGKATGIARIDKQLD